MCERERERNSRVKTRTEINKQAAWSVRMITCKAAARRRAAGSCETGAAGLCKTGAAGAKQLLISQQF